jgi:hypothetical protein
MAGTMHRWEQAVNPEEAAQSSCFFWGTFWPFEPLISCETANLFLTGKENCYDQQLQKHIYFDRTPLLHICRCRHSGFNDFCLSRFEQPL